jgi:diacylglycerol kinase (ATP)
VSKPDHVILLTNPTSGKGAGLRAGQRARAVLREAGIEVTDIAGVDVGDTEKRASVALAADPDAALVVCGGDGMVSLGLRLIAGTERSFGLIPAGTGNDTARTVGIPLGDPEAAARLIVEGRSGTLDLGEATTGAGPGPGVVRRFSTVLACGLDSRVNDRANRMSWPRGQRRYDLALVLELRVFNPIAFEIRLDGQTLRTDCMLVAVGNGPSYGGGMLICPEADPHDGRFQVTVVRKVGKLTLLRIFPKVFSGRHVTHPAVSVYEAAQVEILADGLSCWADGEHVGELPVLLRTLPGAVRMFQPAAAG